VEAVLLREDLLRRESSLAGQAAVTEPIVLTREQARGTAPLPDQLAVGPEAGLHLVPADATWAAYWRYVAALAEGRRSRFLAVWVASEVGTRNALALARAEALGLDASRYLVAPELGRSEPEDAGVIREWAAAPNALAAQQVLVRARWRWVHANDHWFSFTDDELPAYALKLQMLHRWQRITPQEPVPRAAAHGGRVSR
jgi:hypothetical protein